MRYVGGDVTVGLRPEGFIDSCRKEKMQRTDLKDEEKITVKVTHRELLGNEVLLYFKFCDKTCIMKTTAENRAQAGDCISIWLDIDQICLFEKGKDKNLFYYNRCATRDFRKTRYI